MDIKAEIVPDELCPHAELGVPMVGGVLFAAETLAIAVGMCSECLTFCRGQFTTLGSLDDPESILRMSDETLRAICIAEGRNPDEVANQTKETMLKAIPGGVYE